MSVPTDFVRSADGTAIAWYDLGGNGPDLLLAHATGFCALMWQPVTTHLTDMFHCVAYDSRGHGRSGRPDLDEGWAWEHYGKDALSVVEAAGLVEPFGIGHSCGGASEILAEEQAPGSFRALYLFEPVIFAHEPPRGPDPDRELAVKARSRRATFPSRADAIETFRSRGPFKHLDTAALTAYVDHGFSVDQDGAVHLRCSPDDEAQVYIWASAHRAYGLLSEVTCPVTVAHGELSVSFSRDDMSRVVERLPHGRLAEWPSFGHFGPLEQPAAFAEAVLRSLTEAVTPPG